MTLDVQLEVAGLFLMDCEAILLLGCMVRQLLETLSLAGRSIAADAVLQLQVLDGRRGYLCCCSRSARGYR